MRKIATKKDSRRKNKRNQILIGLLLVFVMVASTFGIITNSFGNSSLKKVEYNGIEFIPQNGFWVTKIGDFIFAFKYNPYESEKSIGKINTLNKYSGLPLYIDSEHPEASYEIYNNFKNVALRITPACIDENDCEENLPIKNCEDNLIIINRNETLKVMQEDNCLFIQGPEENLTRITDGVLYKIVGVV